MQVLGNSAENGGDDFALPGDRFREIGFHINDASPRKIHSARRKTGREFQYLADSSFHDHLAHCTKARFEYGSKDTRGVFRPRAIGERSAVAAQKCQHLFGRGNRSVIAARKSRYEGGDGDAPKVVAFHVLFCKHSVAFAHIGSSACGIASILLLVTELSPITLILAKTVFEDVAPD